MHAIEKGFPDDLSRMAEPDRDLCTVRIVRMAQGELSLVREEEGE